MKDGSRKAAAEKERPFAFNATEFVAALGLGLLFALLQVEISNDLSFSRSLSLAPALNVLAELVGTASFCVAIALCWRYSDRITRLQKRHVCFFGSIALATLVMLRCIIRAFALNMWPVSVAIDLVSGALYAFVLVSWVAGIWLLQQKAAVRVMFLSLCIATGCTALIAIIPTSLLRYLTMAVCLMLSGFSYLAARPHVYVEEFVSREESRNNVKFDMRTSVSLFIAALAYGFCFSFVVSFGETSFAIIAISFLIAAIVVAAGMIVFGDRSVLLSTFFRWMYPVLTVGFIMMPFTKGIALYAATALVLAVSFACLVSLFVTLVQLKLRYQVQPAYACARVLLPWAMGMVAGFAAALIGLQVYQAFGDTAIAGPSLLIIALFSLATAIAPYGLDMLTMPIEQNDEGEVEEGDSRDLHAWKTACETIAEECGLTPREKDVFMLLAKGRNAKVIERELFISVYTIKGHNNNIYRKLGVKSQQELIDLVENRRSDIWKPVMEIEQGGDHE